MQLTFVSSIRKQKSQKEVQFLPLQTLEHPLSQWKGNPSLYLRTTFPSPLAMTPQGSHTFFHQSPLNPVPSDYFLFQLSSFSYFFNLSSGYSFTIQYIRDSRLFGTKTKPPSMPHQPLSVLSPDLLLSLSVYLLRHLLQSIFYHSGQWFLQKASVNS